MSFLNPIILFGLFAAAIPLLIHLLTRTKKRIIPFSTLRFLKELSNQQNRRLRLRQLLLLILRTLIVIFLILAFARPTLRGSLSGLAADAKTSTVIIVDNGLSMNRTVDGVSLLSVAKTRAAQILELMQPGDQVFLLTSTDTSSDYTRRVFHDPVVANKFIAGVKLNYARTDFSAALSAAQRRLAQSSNINKEIYLISDCRRSGFAADSTIMRDETIRLYAVLLNTPDPINLAVQSIELKSTVLQTGKVAQVAVTVANTGRKSVSGSVLRLYVDEKPVAQTAVELQAGAVTAEVLRFPIERSGLAAAYALLEDDDLVDDNRRDLAFRVPDSLRIALVGQKPDDTFFIKLALNPDNSPAPFYRVQATSLTDLRQTALSDVDVLFLSNITSVDEQTVEKIRTFVEEGGGLILALGENIDLRSYNTLLLPRLDLPALLDVIAPLAANSPEFILGKADLAHPLFNGIFENQESEFAKPVFHFAVRVQQTAAIDPIIRYSTGDPFLFEKKMGEGRILVVTTGFEPRLTDLSRRTIFAPLVTGIVAYAGSAGSLFSKGVQIGEELRFQLPAALASAGFEMERPDGQFDRLNPQMTAGGAGIVYPQTDLPGIYRLTTDSAAIKQWAVQTHPDESLLTPTDAGTLEKKYRMTLVPANTDLVKFITSQRFGAELWKLCVWIVLILLIVEMFLYREKGETSAEAAGV